MSDVSLSPSQIFAAYGYPPHDVRQHTQRLVPPRPDAVLRLHIVLLRRRRFRRRLVKRQLQADVCLYVPFCGLGRDEAGDVEGPLDVDLRGR